MILGRGIAPILLILKVLAHSKSMRHIPPFIIIFFLFINVMWPLFTWDVALFEDFWGPIGPFFQNPRIISVLLGELDTLFHYDVFSAGYYCPNGTEYSTQYPCPPGTYNSLQLGTSIDDCQSCTLGMYCEGQGNPEPTGNCSAGWYCSGGADSPNTTTHGGQCQAGYYCPEGR